MEASLGQRGATRQSWSRSSIRAVIFELQTDNPLVDHDALVKLLAERMRDDDDALIAAADYAVTAAENAQDGYSRGGARRRRSPQESARERAEIAAAVENIKSQILLLNLEMPNGKRMRYCTGAEMAKFGKAYERIAKKVGSTKMVASVLSEAQVRALMR